MHDSSQKKQGKQDKGLQGEKLTLTLITKLVATK